MLDQQLLSVLWYEVMNFLIMRFCYICSTRSYKPGKKNLCMRVVPIFQQLLDPLRALSPLCLEGMLHGRWCLRI